MIAKVKRGYWLWIRIKSGSGDESGTRESSAVRNTTDQYWYRCSANALYSRGAAYCSEQDKFSQELRGNKMKNCGLKPKSKVERENPVIPHRIPSTFPPSPNSVTNSVTNTARPLPLTSAAQRCGATVHAAEPILQDILAWFPPKTGVHSYTAVHCQADAGQVIFC